MPHYLLQWAFKDPQIKAMKDNPQDREPEARKVIEGCGGKLQSYFFAFGEYDGVAVCEFPDNESATALGIRVCQSVADWYACPARKSVASASSVSSFSPAGMTPSPIQTGKLEWTNGWPIYSTGRGLDRTTRFPARMTCSESRSCRERVGLSSS